MSNLDADLNALYDAALELGENWRRPVAELAAERLPHRSAEERADLARTVEACRTAVEAHVASVYTEDATAGAAMEAASRWVAEQYPWMTPENVQHGVSQGGYYAWHG